MTPSQTESLECPEARTAVTRRPQPKIAHLALSLQPGGLETIIASLALSRAMDGMEAVVCCLDERGALAATVETAGVRVTVVKRKPGFDLGLIPRLARFFRREGVDILHTHSLDPLFYGGLAARLAGVPVRIHTQHDVSLKRYGLKDRMKFRLGAWLATELVAVSEETQRGLARYGVPAGKRQTIVNAIDEEKFAGTCANCDSAAHGVGQWTIGTVARLSPEKGLDRLLAAFARVQDAHPESRLLIAGDGPERSRLETLTERLGVAPCVEFLGYQKNVERLLPRLDLFVLPSLTEGIPLALLEAMSAGLPGVATAVGGVPEVIVNGESGVLVPPDDTEALAAAITGLMEDPGKRLELGRRAAARIRERFSLVAMARSYRRLYRDDPPDEPWRRAIKTAIEAIVPPSRLLWRAPRGCRRVALTFDDGPDPFYTPRILEILGRYNVPATFFLIGAKAERERTLVREIAAAGHEIGNHSQTHPDFERLSWKEAAREIAEARAAIEDALGRPCRLFRPPLGKLCVNSLAGAWRQGLQVVMWSADLKDFRAESAEDIEARLARRPIADGDVVLYHSHNAAALEALPRVIEAALAGGRVAATASRVRAS